ncbi:WXG residues type VII secretion target family protein [Mycobacteroides abscessus MAB_030201_1075]|uniref:WXG residues type VII secretion target family protein n=1 Tax=Mycobacteroides abscessus MAB_030201_1075 TaxID=1335410 RepID=A0A829PH91_9MYCO|nr:WXG100 family type VII secretion target [Mycobacteroides abscessus]ETZ88199.1 WXG residues type VII secretion target family protein [Mycobacteroides abscessus MAB_030201_1075]
MSGGSPMHLSVDAVIPNVDRLGTVARDLEESLRQLVSDVEGVVGVSWTGDSAKLYEESWQDFREAASRIVDDAKEIESRVRGNVTQFLQQEATNTFRLDGAR